MEKRLFVGNISYRTSDESLRQEFAKYGTVKSAKILTDRETGQSRGFGFVEFELETEAAAAMQALDGAVFEGRNLAVKVAENRPRPGGGGGGGGGQRFNNPPPQQNYGGGGGGGGSRGGGGRDRKRRRDRDDNDWG